MSRLDTNGEVSATDKNGSICVFITPKALGVEILAINGFSSSLYIWALLPWVAPK